MSKPGTIFDWGTDTNFASGPATGQPVKVVLPDTGQALLPGDDLIPEYLNYGLYWTSQWVSWLNDGSPDGAADAHVVETDSIGATAVTRVREEWHFQQVFLSSDWPGDYPQWEEAATGSSAASPSGGANELTAGNSTGNAITIYTGGGAIVDTDNGCEFIVVARVTSVLTTMSFFFGVSDTGGTFPLENSEAHFGVGIIYRAGTDTNWTLAGQDGGGTLTVAASSTAVVQNEWHRFRVRVLTDGSAALYIDGATSAAATLAAAVVGGGPAQVFLSTLKVTANVTRTSEIEVVHLWKPYAA